MMKAIVNALLRSESSSQGSSGAKKSAFIGVDWFVRRHCCSISFLSPGITRQDRHPLADEGSVMWNFTVNLTLNMIGARRG